MFRDAGVQRPRGLPRRASRTRRCRGSCSSSTSSRSSSSRTTSSRRKRRCCSTASCGRAGRSACTSCSARRRSAGRTRSPAAPSTRWRSASRCSVRDADAQLILSKDNTAARLLVAARRGDLQRPERPGRRERPVPGRVARPRRSASRSSKDLHDAGRRTSGRRRWCSRATRTPTWRTTTCSRGNSASPAIAKAPAAWLGDPVAIKDPTAAVFRPLGGANLLVIGQNEEAARGLFAAACLAWRRSYRLSADCASAEAWTRHPDARAAPRESAFTILDGTPDDADDAEYFAEVRREAARRGRAGRGRACPRRSRNSPPRWTAGRRANRPTARRGSCSSSASTASASCGRRRTTSASAGAAAETRAVARRAVHRAPARRPAGRHSRRRLVRLADEPEPRLRPAAAPRVRAARAVPDERDRLQHADGLAGRAPSSAAPGRSSCTEEPERPEKFRPYGLPSPEWLDVARASHGSG